MSATLERIVVLAAVAALTCAQVQARDLKINNFQSPRTLEVKMQEEILKEIEKGTNKSLTGKIFAGGQLLGPAASLGGLRDGVVDVAFIAPTIHMSELKHAVVVDDLLPYQQESYAAAGASSETLMVACPECKEDWTRQNSVFLGSHGPTPWHLMCTGQVTFLDDLRGKKVRVTGNSATRLVKALGMVAVNLTPPEIAPALQGGQIDCTVGPLTWFEDYSFYDYMRTVIDYPLGVYGGLGVWVMNKKTFDALKPAERKVVIDVQPGMMAKATAFYQKQEQEVRRKAASKTRFWKPSPEFIAAIEKYRKEDIPNIIADMRSRGVKDPERIVKGHLAAVAKWNKLIEEKGATPEAFAALLKQEIYSKAKF